MKQTIQSIIFAAVIWLVSINVFATEIIGRVVAVADGDTLTVIDSNNTEYKIRLSGIDAPEKSQPFGKQSKQSLAEMVFSKTVVIEYNKRDKYKRIVGKVLFDNNDINLEQIRRGMAWHYKYYESEQDLADRSVYAIQEHAARRDDLGLWLDKNPLQPWAFRKKGAVTRKGNLDSSSIQARKEVI